MSTQSQAFSQDLRAYMQEQEKAPLYGKSFFEGVMAGTMNRVVKKWAIQHHYRTRATYSCVWRHLPEHGLGPLTARFAVILSRT
jgi:hypothetical protein